MKGWGPHRSTWFRSHRHTWTLQPFLVSQEHVVAQSTAPATKSSPTSALSQGASEACACKFSARAQLFKRRSTQRLGSHRSTCSKQRACYEIQLQNPRGTWLQLHSCRSLHKHARANLARERSFSSVGARSGLGLTGARERSKSLKIVRLPRNLAPGRGGRGGDGKHTRSSAPAQHCIHTRERGSAPASTHAGGGGWGW